MSALPLWAAKNPLLALLLCGMLVAAGVSAARSLPIDAVPDVTNVQVQVVTRAPSLSAAEVEVQVTQPIERAMTGAPGLHTIRSVTRFGISIVTLVFHDDVDLYFARTQVNERLQLVRDRIPPEVGVPELGPIATALGEIYMFELKPTGTTGRTAEELRTIVEWQVAPRLRQVPGVVEVVAFGGALKQYQVLLDPTRLAAHGISVEQVREALVKDNRLSGGGVIERGGEQIVLRGDAIFHGLEDIAQVVVRAEGGVPIRVGHLGTVDTGPAPRQGAMTRDGRGEVVGASVLMLRGQNSRVVVAAVKKAIVELAPRLPAGVSIDPWYDRAQFIDSVLGTVAKNLTEGALIVVGCLLLTLGSIRAGLLVAGGIPFAMLVGFIGLKATGYSGNVMSLGAIDFGIIVEGAVLTVEHALGHGAAIRDARLRREAIVKAIAEVSRPAVFGVVITLLVFLPLATLQDIEGKMFRPVVYSLCFMLTGALVYALVLLPAVAPWVLKASGEHQDPWLSRKAKVLYEPVLAWALRRPAATVGAAFALTFGLLALGGNLGSDFLPRVFEGAFAIDALRPVSTALPTAVALGRETEVALRQVPEVETVVNRIGRPEDAVDPAGPESSDVFVILKPRSAWRKGLTPERLVEELGAKLAAAVPATQNAFSQPIEMRVNDLVAGVKSDLAIRVYGEDLDTMAAAADKIRAAVAAIPGAADVRREAALGLPSVRAKVKRERAGRLGVDTGELLEVLQAARSGLPAGTVREGERVFDLVLRVGSEATPIQSAADLARLPIATRSGELVPLSMVADVAEELTVIQISREQMKRRLTVQANVRGRDLVGFVAEAQAKVAQLDLPRSMEVVWGGQFQSFNRARSQLLLLVPVALGVILLMLVITFRSLLYSVVTMLGLPFALAGGVVGLLVRDLPFSIPAGVGFIALAGVSVMTGIVMTSNLAQQDPSLPASDRVAAAALMSLRVVLSTALMAAVGFVPAAIATGTGSEVQRPLATVVIGGLSLSLLLSLLALPAMLLFVARREDRRRALAAAPTDPPVEAGTILKNEETGPEAGGGRS